MWINAPEQIYTSGVNAAFPAAPELSGCDKWRPAKKAVVWTGERGRNTGGGIHLYKKSDSSQTQKFSDFNKYFYICYLASIYIE